MPKQTVNTSPEVIRTITERGVDTLYPSAAEFKKRLASGKPLTIYHGVDPSGPDLHIGHMIPLQKLRQLQQAGHKVILLIGNFTGQTGDPTDKQAVRVPLTSQQVAANAKHYQKQASTVLDFEGPNKAELRYNADWLGKLSFAEVAELAGHFTVQQMVERDMFADRLKQNKPISLREFLYPLMQGYDSVAMEVDMEIGGTDQTFNMLAGRKLLKEYRGKDKLVLTLPLLADSNGVKIGKSEGNAIAIAGTPEDLYGQVMALPDEVVVNSLAWVTSVPQAEVDEVAKQVKTDPMGAKKRLAFAIVREFQGEPAAQRGQKAFESTHQAGEVSEEEWPAGETRVTLWRVMKQAGLVSSSSEARRKITEGAVRVNGEVVKDAEMQVPADGSHVVQYGKKKPRAIRVVQ